MHGWADVELENTHAIRLVPLAGSQVSSGLPQQCLPLLLVSSGLRIQPW
jgi:hypothetical protein